MPASVPEGWFVAARDVERRNDPVVQALFAEAGAAVPPGFANEDVIAMLPRRRGDGQCRLCGAVGPLTKEHVPPKASGNSETGRSHSYGDWLDSTELGELPGGQIEQGGIFGFTLCRSCNSFTGRKYGTAYRDWALAAEALLAELPHPLQLDKSVDTLGWPLKVGSKEDGGLSAGAFVRQVLSCFCTLSGTWDLAERQSAIRRIVLEQSVEPLPPGIELGMSLYFGPNGRMVGPSLMVDPDAGEWRWMMEMAYPPFAFILVLASNVAEPGLGLLMNDFVTLPPAAKQQFEGIARVGFGWSPYPGDYRSRGQIEAERQRQAPRQ